MLDPTSVGTAGNQDIEEQIEEIDDLLIAVTALTATNTTEFARLNSWLARTEERMTECLTRTEQLATAQTGESPLLTQLLSMTAELKGEFSSLKSSVESIQNRLTELRSIPTSESMEELPVENVEDENPEARIENLPTTPTRKNRFV